MLLLLRVWRWQMSANTDHRDCNTMRHCLSVRRVSLFTEPNRLHLSYPVHVRRELSAFVSSVCSAQYLNNNNYSSSMVEWSAVHTKLSNISFSNGGALWQVRGAHAYNGAEPGVDQGAKPPPPLKAESWKLFVHFLTKMALKLKDLNENKMKVKYVGLYVCVSKLTYSCDVVIKI